MCGGSFDAHLCVWEQKPRIKHWMSITVDFWWGRITCDTNPDLGASIQMKQPEFEPWHVPCTHGSAIRAGRYNIVNKNITKLISIFYDFEVHICVKNSTHDDIQVDDVGARHGDAENTCMRTIDVVCVGEHAVEHDGLVSSKITLVSRLEQCGAKPNLSRRNCS